MLLQSEMFPSLLPFLSFSSPSYLREKVVREQRRSSSPKNLSLSVSVYVWRKEKEKECHNEGKHLNYPKQGFISPILILRPLTHA